MTVVVVAVVPRRPWQSSGCRSDTYRFLAPLATADREDGLCVESAVATTADSRPSAENRHAPPYAMNSVSSVTRADKHLFIMLDSLCSSSFTVFARSKHPRRPVRAPLSYDHLVHYGSTYTASFFSTT